MQRKRTILIVDDEPTVLESLQLLLEDKYNLLTATSGEDCLQRVQVNPVDVIFLDIELPGMDGFETLRQIKNYDENIDVIMLTADEKAKTALRCIELGAFHYITKPYDKDEIELVLNRVFEKKEMAEEISSLRDDVNHLSAFHGLIGEHPKMREIYSLIDKIAETDTSVMITGESGTGKELVANALHFKSDRKKMPFKAINCGAIPETLLESELFGHEKGAFTGAHQRKIGKFEMANEGSIFLDEISAMQEILQVKLLRVLQEREIERIGGIKGIPINVRLITATNRDMRQLVEMGRFREDLFYRINVIHIQLPPLRERGTDVVLLAEHFLHYYANKFNKHIYKISSDAKKYLLEYSWPGNVRELRNVMERAVVLSNGETIQKDDLPFDLMIPAKKIPVQNQDHFSLKDAVEGYEKKVILNILERSQWNQTRAAETLGIHRNTLLMKLDAYNINVKKLKSKTESRSTP